MITKLRKNFNLCNVLARILFVLTFVFASWQTYLSATVLVMGQATLWLALVTSIVVGVALMFLLPVIANLILNWSRIFSVPRAEYCLLCHIFGTLGFLICGLLNLVNLFTPIFSVWGGVLFPFVSLLICAISFYVTTSKLYFNVATRVYYFKVCLIVFFVLVVILEVF